MKGIIIGAVVGCVALIGLAVFFSVNSKGTGPRVVPMNQAYTDRVSDGYWKKGILTPKVTLLEYLDFQCPACQAMSTIIPQVMQQVGEYTQLQNRVYTIPTHDKAVPAARAAEAAGRQGKYWEMEDILYANQKDWTTQTPNQFQQTLDSYAQSLSLNLDQFHADMDDPTTQDQLDHDKSLADRIPLQGTPTFVVNGKVLTTIPKSVGEFVQIIQQAAEQASPSPAQ